MKKNKNKNTGFSFVGAVLFFILIAFVMQIAILVYEHIRKRTDNNALIAVLILVVILVLSALCVIVDLIRRKYTVEKPTQKILQATERIASGDFDTKLYVTHEYSKYNQYDLIMDNLNKMTEELKKTEILKMDFISNVSHEIKTPLTVIQSYAALLKDDSLDAETRKKYSETLISASKRITNLITNILKLNKLENQEIQEKKERFNLTEALSESIIEFDNVIENKKLTLECDFDEITVVSVKSLLEIVWNNLISNAIKFTDEGGVISVTLKKKGSAAEITVTDSGIGMSKETGARIFEKFYQGDSSHSVHGNGLVWNNLISNAIKFTDEGGVISVTLKKKGSAAEITVTDSGIGMSKETGARIFEKFYQGDSSHSVHGNGLGLALVKRVIDILGGDISVKSELGNGSSFSVLLKDIAE